MACFGIVFLLRELYIYRKFIVIRLGKFLMHVCYTLVDLLPSNVPHGWFTTLLSVLGGGFWVQISVWGPILRADVLNIITKSLPANATTVPQTKTILSK